MKPGSPVAILFTIFALVAYSFVISNAGVDPASSPSGQYFESGGYDASIPAPSEFLGFPLGSKPANHAQFGGYLKLLSDSSPRAELHTYGYTYENHELYYLIVTSENNMARLDQIKSAIAEISDPGSMKTWSIDKVISDLPAVVWAGYGIHGDELSSTDAALATAYQLAAGTDEETRSILDSLVVLIDPSENPDGRERFLTQVRQFSSDIPNPDLQSIPHTGVWPWGRGNHYLVDLNRDTFTLVYPETRGKMSVWIDWHPQVIIDSHEMGALSSYLFSPPRAPFNPDWPAGIMEWWDIFASDQAKAFDRYGWSYFTRDWNEELFPGYTSSWGTFSGAIGILYEEAGVEGGEVRQKTGKILTYPETVHHHFVSSMANLMTAATNREALLRRYYQTRTDALANRDRSLGEEFIVDRTQNPGRVDRFVETLLLQGIRVRKSDRAFGCTGLRNEHGGAPDREFPAGTYIIDFAQPSRYLLQTLVDYDIRFPNSFLAEERRYLEKGWGTRMYDISAWSMPLAYDLKSYISGRRIDAASSQVMEIGESAGKIIGENPLYGYMMDNSDDRVMNLLAEALSSHLNVRVAAKPTAIEGLNFKRGSLLFVKKENPDTLQAILAGLAEKHGVDIHGISTALASSGPDLGSGDFELLVPPKVAMLTGPSIGTSVYGAFWHLFDRELGIRVSPIDINGFSRVDLSNYNVLVFPSPWGGVSSLKSILGKDGISKLKEWVEDGGTLVAMGNAAAFCCDTSVDLSAVSLRRNVLDKLDEYEYAVQREIAADNVTIDSLRIWEAKEPKKEKKEEPPQKPTREELARQDEFAQKFSPEGVILDCRVDTTEWLSYGLGEDLPAILFGSWVFLSKPPVSTVARLKGENEIRLSGLAWPETRARFASSAYCTREGKGRGQVILFSSNPYLRSYFHGTNRLFLNAVFLGPGLGTRQPLPY